MAFVPLPARSTASKVDVNKLVSKYSSDGDSETIKILCNIIKINKRNKKQERLFVLTDKAIYNIKKKTIKRRIALSQIAAITKSSTSTEFSLSIPSEYDYRFDAKDKITQNEIISSICESIVSLKQEVLLTTISASETSAWTVTKTNLKLLEHCNDTVRMAMAVDQLHNMGFKSQTSLKAFTKSKGSLSVTVHSLVGDYVKDLEENKTAWSPFVSPSLTPMSTTFSPLSSPYRSLTPAITNQLSPTVSFTEMIDVDDVFVL